MGVDPCCTRSCPASNRRRSTDGRAGLSPALIAGAAADARPCCSCCLASRCSRRRLRSLAGWRGQLCALRAHARRPIAGEPLVVGPDFALRRIGAGPERDPVALTERRGLAAARQRRLSRALRRCAAAARARCRRAMRGRALELAQTMAWRDGAGCVAGIETGRRHHARRGRARRRARRPPALALSQARRARPGHARGEPAARAGRRSAAARRRACRLCRSARET